jgi:FKBP-type peptidyl-prolyl cis-trans isomerase
MQKKKDIKVFVGIVIIVIIVILSILGYKNFNGSLAVPQINDQGSIVDADVKAIPSGDELLGKKDTNKMEPVQVIKKENGLIIEILNEGSGIPVRTGDIVSVDYRGFFTNGTVFDESYKRGVPFSFTVGAGNVIVGWDEGLLGMKVGEKRRLTVPSDLAYGPNDYHQIPGGSTLIFDIELRKIGQ